MDGRSADGRRMTWFGLLGLLIAFLIVPSVVSVFFFDSQSERLFPDAQAGLKVAAVHAVGTAIAALAITAKRWWPAVLHEGLPARRWVWLPVAAILVTAIALADYGRVATAGAAAVGALALGVLMIALGEELMFRGVWIVFLRARTGELGVALISSAVFGLAHVLAGPIQMLLSMIFGFVLYAARRVSGGIAVPVLVHVAWDLSVFTSFLTAEPSEGSDASVALALLSIIAAAVLAVGWRRLTPRTSSAPVTPA